MPIHVDRNEIKRLTTYTVTGLAQETTYHFKLMAFDQVPNDSVFSASASVTTLDETPPAPPTSVTVLLPEHDSLTVSWMPNTESDVVGYYVYRSKSTVHDFELITTELVLKNYYSLT